MLEMAVESLAELGYKTLTATNAATALDRLHGPDRVDILFSDVVMPGGMNGVQLAVEARRLRPDLRVLLTSDQVCGDEKEALTLTEPYAVLRRMVEESEEQRLPRKPRSRVTSRKERSRPVKSGFD